MECPRCGTQNDDKRQFCFTCGNPLASNMLDAIDFGKTQAQPVVVTPIEPMSKEEELRNTSVIPVISEEVTAEPIVLEEDEKKAELLKEQEEAEKAKAIRDDLIFTSEMKQVKVNIKQLESVNMPKKKPVGLIVMIIVLFLACAAGVIFWLYKKDKITFLKKPTTVIVTTTTTTEFKVALDEEIKAKSDEVILNANSHTLKYSYEITKEKDAYKPLLKIYLDGVVIGDTIIQDNSYKLKEAYNAIQENDIFIIEEQVIKGTDKDYYYININVNEKFYVFILNETTCIYKNVTNMFEATDATSVYNNKSSLLKNGNYSYVEKQDEANAIEKISTINEDVVTFADGEVVPGILK